MPRKLVNTARFELRLTEAEKATLRARAERFGLTASEYARLLILGVDRSAFPGKRREAEQRSTAERVA